MSLNFRPINQANSEELNKTPKGFSNKQSDGADKKEDVQNQSDDEQINHLPSSKEGSKDVSEKNELQRSNRTLSDGGKESENGKVEAPEKPKPSLNPIYHARRLPPGTKFNWTDNKDVDDTPIRMWHSEAVNRAKMVVILRSVDGREFQFKYRHRYEVDLNDPKSVTLANRWRSKLFRLHLYKPAGSYSEAARLAWTQKEKDSLSEDIKTKIRSTGKAISKQDWSDLTQAHNKKFAGQKIPVGEPLAQGQRKDKTTGSIIADKAVKVAQSPFTLRERSVRGIQRTCERWEDILDMIRKERREQADKDTRGEIDSDTDDSNGDGTEDDSDSEIDLEVEEDSDDDMDGQQPGTDTTGGIEADCA